MTQGMSLGRRGTKPYEHFPTGHLVIENLPVDQGTMRSLHEFYKEFGEISTIHCVPNQNMAYVGFRNAPSAFTAASTSATRPPLGNPAIKVSFHNGNPPRISKAEVEVMPVQEISSHPTTDEVPQIRGGNHLIMESEEAKKQRELRETQRQRSKERERLLSEYTGTVKSLIEKMTAPNIKEESRETYSKMLTLVKGKMSSLQQEVDAERKKEQAVVNRVYAARVRAFERQKREFAAKKQQEMTLDLRSRCVITSELPKELQQIDVLAEYLKEMGHKQLVDVVWVENRMKAVLRFETHEAAEQLISSQPGFESTWIGTREVQTLIDGGAEVERAEILQLADDVIAPSDENDATTEEPSA